MALTTNISYHSFANGIRAVAMSCACGVDYFGVCVNAGSRDEDQFSHGLANFVEHTLFKGTVKRRLWHIINRMERIGGELNAYTTKEETVVYTIAPTGNLARAAELVADLIANSTFPERELIKERDVVEDEINSYLDTPSEAIYDDFEELIFRGNSLGHNILGDSESVSRLSGDDCRRWITGMFVPEDMTLFYVGPKSAQSVFSTLGKYFSKLNHKSSGRQRKQPEVLKPFHTIKELSLHQTHTVAGARIPGLYDSQSLIFAFLANIIGGPGMNSLLNVEMRERRGLVYTVEASTVSYTDCGLFTVYFGCDHSSLKRCNEVMQRVFATISSNGLSLRKIEEAKRQYLGQLAVSGENREQVSLSAGRSMLYRGKVVTRAEQVERINSLTPDMIAEAATMLAPENFSILSFT